MVDFSMSSAQREHASAVEELVPEFVELRVRVCGSMCKDRFWMIYFLLLLPRLNADDFELLSTPKASFLPILIYIHDKKKSLDSVWFPGCW